MSRSHLGASSEDALIAPAVPEHIARLAKAASAATPRNVAPMIPEDLNVFLAQWVKEVLTAARGANAADPGLHACGAMLYRALCTLRLNAGMGSAEAARRASDDLSRFLTLVCDHTPEGALTLKDVCKGFLKVDQEYFGGKCRSTLVRELLTRGLLFPGDLRDFNAREQALPRLWLNLAKGASPDELDIARLIDESSPELGLGGALGLAVQALSLDGEGRSVARVALTFRGHITRNRGLLIFRADGSLSDWQAALPPGLAAGDAEQLLERAEAVGLAERGQLQLCARRAGGFTVKATERRVPGRRPQVFTLEQPNGVPPSPPAFASPPSGVVLLTG